MTIAGSPSVHYRLDLSQTLTQRLGVEVMAEREGSEPVDFVMPKLSPGSPRNSLDHPARLLGLQARASDGSPAQLIKTEAGKYRVLSEMTGPVSLHYQVKADEFSHVRSYLSPQLAYINGPSAMPWVEGRQHQPSWITLTNLPSQTWKISSNLESPPEQPQRLYASSFADIADSNILAGDFASLSSRQGDTLLQVNQNGTPPWPQLKVNGASLEESLEDLKLLQATFQEEFGPFPRQRFLCSEPLPAGLAPHDKYVVTKHYLHGPGTNAGGYEHYHGQELLFSRSAQSSIQHRFDGDGRAHERHIMAHELMHKLLAKYVLHDQIDSLDLSRVGSCDGLWLTEGGVEWAAMALQRRSGQMSSEQYQKMLQDQFRNYQEAYAQDPSNARDNSQDAHLGNRGFYNKGAVTCALLDLELKAATAGQRGLFDVFRGLKDEFGGQGKGWKLEDVERICTQMSGSSPEVAAFFGDYLHQRQEFDFSKILAKAGMAWNQRPQEFSATAEPSSGRWESLGVNFAPNKEQPKLTSVRAGSQAEALGLGAWVGQVPQSMKDRLDPAGNWQGLELEFASSDPFTGAAGTHSFALTPQELTRGHLETLPGTHPLRETWLAG